MKNTFLILFYVILNLALLSCHKKLDPNPELQDSVYNNLKMELELSIKQEEDLKSQVKKDLDQFRTTVPQKGLITGTRNKYSASENNLSLVAQQKKYFEIKLEQRKIYVQKRYLETHLKNGRPWPDEKEQAEYKVRMKLQREKFDWEAKHVPRGTADKTATDGQPAAPAAH